MNISVANTITIPGTLSANTVTLPGTLSANTVTVDMVQSVEYEMVPWLDSNGDEIVDHNGDTIYVKVPV